MIRALALGAVWLALAAPAGAQNYGLPTPQPRLTDPGALRERARDREVLERFRRGLSAQDRADWSTAVGEFERAIALDPGEPRNSTAHYDLGIALARLGRLDAAAAAFAEALRRDPGFAAAAANLVEVALQRGDLARAREAAERLAAIAPASLLAQYDRGIVALRQNDLAAARLAFRALLQSSPRYAVAHYDLAVTELRDGRYDAARAELDQALLLSPKYARARFARAVLSVRDGRATEARADLDRVVIDADDPALRDLALAVRGRLADARL